MVTTIEYFAYGSNMNYDRLMARGVIPSTYRRGYLPGYRLKFNKQAYNKPGVGYANIVPDINYTVEGVLYRIDTKDLDIIDKYEGYPKHYNRLQLRIFNPLFTSILAWVYLAQPNRVVEGLHPEEEYLNYLRRPAMLLSEEYSQYIINETKLDNSN